MGTYFFWLFLFTFLPPVRSLPLAMLDYSSLILKHLAVYFYFSLLLPNDTIPISKASFLPTALKVRSSFTCFRLPVCSPRSAYLYLLYGHSSTPSFRPLQDGYCVWSDPAAGAFVFPIKPPFPFPPFSIIGSPYNSLPAQYSPLFVYIILFFFLISSDCTVFSRRTALLKEGWNCA